MNGIIKEQAIKLLQTNTALARLVAILQNTWESELKVVAVKMDL